MVEIALCLAIIGFALVAIIGVLPTGMNVQKDNREETIINQDATVWMDAIRGGAQGCDDLANYVIAITNIVWHYRMEGTNAVLEDPPNPDIFAFTHDGSTRNGVATVPQYLLINGWRIMSILSRPKYEPYDAGFSAGFHSNHVVVLVRAMSGAVADKFPQDNPTVLNSAFGYRMTAEFVPYVPFDPSSTNYDPALVLSDQDRGSRSNYMRLAYYLKANSHDLRLLFRWPLLPNYDVGNGRQTFRALTIGGLTEVTNIAFTSPGSYDYPLFFFEPFIHTNSP